VSEQVNGKFQPLRRTISSNSPLLLLYLTFSTAHVTILFTLHEHGMMGEFCKWGDD